MIVDSIGSTGAAIVGAIRNAAQATGANFQYLLATAQVESAFNATATVSTSSAKGLFQFIEQTWLATVKQAGPALGYGRYADAIVQSPSGNYAVPDPAMRREVLALRDDPAANAAMAGAFTQQNAALLTERIGRTPTEGELYIAHFLGAGGGAQLINLAQQNPGATAASAFPNAAKANPSIFYDRQGHARSAAEVYHVLVARYDVARAAPTVSTAAATSAITAAAATPPAATAAPAMTAQITTPTATPATPPAVTVALPLVAPTGPVFHSLFSDTRRQPVSQVVQDLWTSNPRVAAALTGQGGAPAATSATQAPPANMSASNGTMDLFSDRPADVRALFGERM
jgi:Transglycosylase SLT domain